MTTLPFVVFGYGSLIFKVRRHPTVVTNLCLNVEPSVDQQPPPHVISQGTPAICLTPDMLLARPQTPH